MRQIAITCGMMLALAGCGGSSEEHHAEGEEHHGEHHAGGEHHGEHRQSTAGPPEVTALHGVIAPIWHSEPGPVRGQIACDQRADLEARTTAVVEGAVPEAAAGDATVGRPRPCACSRAGKRSPWPAMAPTPAPPRRRGSPPITTRSTP